MRLDCGGGDDYDLVVLRVRVGRQRAPFLAGAVEIRPLRSAWASAHVVESRLVGRYHAGASAALDGHVADGHAPFHGQLADSLAGVLYGVSCRARHAYLADDSQDDVLGGHAGGERAVHPYLHRLGLELAQGLGGEDMLDFGCADADCERAERAVRGRVAVAADDDLPRLSQPLLRPYDVDYPLIRAEAVVERDAEILAVALQMLELLGGDGVGYRAAQLPSGGVVVHGGDGEVWAAHFAPRHPQPLERLRRRDFVNQMEVDVQQAGLPLFLAYRVGVPYLLEHSLGGHLANPLRCGVRRRRTNICA